MEGYDASTYGERFADVYDAWYGQVTDTEACTARLAELAAEAGGGPVLELGVGSGRLALPLVERGLRVFGIDSSPAMVERLRAKPGGDRVEVTVGDMADLPVADPPQFAVVFAAFNTFFNLATEADQRRCLAHVARVLAPDGAFVLEAALPPDPGTDRTGGVALRHLTADEVVLTVTSHDRAAQTLTGQHVHLTEAGTRLRPWHLRYATPEQLDAMAESAGLVLRARWGGWDRRPFGDDEGVHVSVYARGNVRDVPPAARERHPT